MIDTKLVKFRNFLSYGDYDTILELDKLKSCLISGDNGCGKSSLTNAILWCISGRTMHSANPGDKVINYNTTTNCFSELLFKNSDKIIRTRKGKDGKDDLLFIEAGADISLGTNKMQQLDLNRKLNFDYTIFCGSVFCSQYNKPWLEMSDPTRKQAIEREFHLDKIQLYAEVAKEYKEKVEVKQNELRIEHNGVMSSHNSTSNDIKQVEEYAANFEADRQKKVDSAQSDLDDLETQLTSYELVDVDKLEERWNLYSQADSKLDEKTQALEGMQFDLRSINSEITSNTRHINSWESKIGICSSCEQPVDDSYVKGKTTTQHEKLQELQEKAKTLQSKVNAEDAKIKALRKKLEALKPTQTVTEAKTINKHRSNILNSIEKQKKNIEQIKQQSNNYEDHLEKLKTKLIDLKTSADKIIEKMKDLDAEILHWSYVYKTYSDRRKIKAQILSEFVPYLNDRIAYYLTRMDMQLRVEFTDGLGVKSNYWGYDFFCGGERKRVDLSIMFGMHDLHELMYGQQANFMVLDEVDSRLDAKGVQAMIDIIRTDLEPKLDSILIISHRHDMKGAMASEIILEKDGPAPTGISKIKEIRI